MIKTEKQYNAACARVEELLRIVGNDMPTDRKEFIELDLLSDLVADYEEANYPVKEPELAEVIRSRMYEMGINQTKLSKILGVSPSRVSEYLNGKSEPPLSIARNICRKLDISASVVLGV